MKHFPDFMKNQKNKVGISQQNTDDIEGYFYEGADNSQNCFLGMLFGSDIKKTHSWF